MQCSAESSDGFIPNLMVLSPQYAEYKKALDNVNDRMCRELGLYYDILIFRNSYLQWGKGAAEFLVGYVKW